MDQWREVICRGCIRLGTGCRKCSKCKKEMDMMIGDFVDHVTRDEVGNNGIMTGEQFDALLSLILSLSLNLHPNGRDDIIARARKVLVHDE